MEKLLSAAQVADHLGMHVKTLYKLVRNNEIGLSFVQIHGRTIAFKPSEIEKYVSMREVRRDGSALKKIRNKPVKRTFGSRLMTDKEAQEFFKNVRVIDGVLESDPDDPRLAEE
jgi:excisionase family DNA binding protein